MEMYYIVTDIPRWLLCERVIRTDGYLLYEYDPENNVYRDSGYAKDLEDLRFKISVRYGRRVDLLLVRDFEKVARLFVSRSPRIIHLARGDVFCIRQGDALFSVKWDHDAEGFFIKKMKWWLDGEEPKSIGEALERLNEYAEMHNKWIVLREWIKEATAYEVRPIP